MLATLLGCVPVSAAASAAPIAQAESPADYAALYADRGLCALFTAFEGDATVNTASGVWQDRVNGASASLGGAWTLGAKGGVGYDLAGNELADTAHYLDLGISLLPSADFTVEYAAKYKNYTSTPSHTGAYYANQKGDEIGTLKQFSVLAGTLEGVSAPLVRWYMSNLSWNEGDVKGSSNRFAFNDTTRASRTLSVYTVTREESQKAAADGSGKYYDLMGDEKLYSAALTFGEDGEYAVGMLVRGFVLLSSEDGEETVCYIDPQGALSGEVSMIDAADYFVNRYDGNVGTAYSYLSAPSLRRVLSLVGKTAREALAEELTIYVDAEKGSDANSGTDAAAPLKSISAAYAAARAHLASESAKGVTVRLAAGRYYTDEPLKLDGADVRTKDYYFNLIGAGKDTVITGGRAIDTSILTTDPDTGFKKITLPMVDGSYPAFRNLSLNGELLSLAHHGSSEECFTIYGEEINETLGTAVLYVDADKLPYGYECRGAEMHLPVEWWLCVIHVDYVDWTNQFTEDGRELVPVYMNYNEYMSKVVNAGHSVVERSFWLENGYELLELNENSYYYDEASGTLYINEGSTLVASGLLEYAALEQLLVFENVENITVESVTLTGTDNRVVRAGQGISAGQSASVYTVNAATGERVNLGYLTASAIRGRNVKGFTVRDAVITAVGGNGIMLDGVTEHLTVESSRFSHIGVTAIHVGNAAYHSSTTYAKDILIRNNEITHVGELVASSNGIYVPVVANLRIIGNTLRHVTYSAIAIGRHWSSSVYTLEEITERNVFRTYNAEIAYNHISDFMTCMRDGGAIYTTGGNAVVTEDTLFNYVHDNYIVFTEETGKHLYEDEETRLVMGIYHDGSSSQWYDTNNVLIYAGAEEQGQIIPLYVQQINRDGSDQRAFHVTLDQNYAIGFKDAKGACTLAALYGIEERMDADRSIIASDYVYADVDALLADDFLLDAVFGNAISAYHSGGAASLVAAVYQNAGASLDGVEKPNGGVTAEADSSSSASCDAKKRIKRPLKEP